MVKKTQEEFEKQVNEKYPYIKMRGKYNGTKSKINCVCDLDGYEWEPSAQNLLKAGCPCCNGKRITLQSFKNKLALIHPEVVILDTDLNVINFHTHLNCKCSVCGLEFNKELVTIQKHGCSRCNTKYHNSRGLGQEEYCQKIYDLYGDDITVLGEYKTGGTMMLHKCNIHNYEWMTLPRTLLSGVNTCKFCYGGNRRNGNKSTLDDLKLKIKTKYGDEYKVLDDVYIDGNHKMKFMHFPKNGIPHTLISYPGRVLDEKSGCPVCSGSQVSKGYNDIATTNPNVAAWFLNKEETFIYSKCSNNKVDFKCPICGNIVHKSINQVSKDNDLRCPICKDGISYPNKFIFNALLQIQDKLDFLQREYRPKWCTFDLKGKKRIGVYDIYFGIHNKQYIIEMDGAFHEKVHNRDENHTLDDIKYIDSEKNRLALENGIQIIRIDCIYDNNDKYDYILHNLRHSILSEILPMDLIDFDEANIKSQKSLLLEACNLWNKGCTANQIIEDLHINKSMVSIYLKQGQHYGLCNDYSGYKSCIRSSGIKVTCVNTGIAYQTISEPATIYNITPTGIQNCCRGIDFSAGKDLNTGEKLFWMYSDDYNKLNQKEVLQYLIDKKVQGYTHNISGKPVYCLTTNKVFDSIMDAQRAYNGCECGIRKCCRGEMKTSGSLPDGTRLHWIFLKDYIETNDMTMEEFVVNYHYSSFSLD